MCVFIKANMVKSSGSYYLSLTLGLMSDPTIFVMQSVNFMLVQLFKHLNCLIISETSYMFLIWTTSCLVVLTSLSYQVCHFF